MDKVSIGEGAVVKRAIIDKNVKVPAGAAIGLDPDLDRARGFKVTDSGITVLSKGQEVPEPGDAERALSAANLHLVPDAVKAATENLPELRESVEQGAPGPRRRGAALKLPAQHRPGLRGTPGARSPAVGRAPCRL